MGLLSIFVFLLCLSNCRGENLTVRCRNCSIRNFQFLRVRYPFHETDTFVCNDQRDVTRGPMLIIDVASNMDSCISFNTRLDFKSAMKRFPHWEVDENLAAIPWILFIISKIIQKSKKIINFCFIF